MDTDKIIKLQAQIIADMARLIDAYNSNNQSVKLMFNAPTNTVADEGKIDGSISNDESIEMGDLSDDEFKKIISGYEKEPETT